MRNLLRTLFLLVASVSLTGCAVLCIGHCVVEDPPIAQSRDIRTLRFRLGTDLQPPNAAGGRHTWTYSSGSTTDADTVISVVKEFERYSRRWNSGTLTTMMGLSNHIELKDEKKTLIAISFFENTARAQWHAGGERKFAMVRPENDCAQKLKLLLEPAVSEVRVVDAY